MHLAAASTITHVSVGAAVTGVAVALLLGFCGARWLQAEDDEQAARARLKGAIRVMWGKRWAMAMALLVLWAVALAWIRGQGR